MHDKMLKLHKSKILLLKYCYYNLNNNNMDIYIFTIK